MTMPLLSSTSSSNAEPGPLPAPAFGAGQRLAALKIDRSGEARPAAARRLPAWRWAALALLACAALAGWWLTRAESVQTAVVIASTPSQQFVQLTASGHVVAQTRAAVASKATGRLVELRVREGSAVKRGDLLARLDASDVDAALQAGSATLQQAQAGLQQAMVEQGNARRDLDRSLGLQAQGFVSAQAVDTRQARLDGAAAGVAAARANVAVARGQLGLQQVNRSYTEIRAPFDGVVLVKNANVGDIITPLSSAAGAQGAVVTMADLSTLEVEVDVSEANLSKASAGQPVEVTLDALPGLRLRGSVASIVPTVDRAKATVTAKIRFERIDPRILPEMSAKVAFLSQPISEQDQRPVLTAPAASVLRNAAGAVVFRVHAEAGAQRVEALAVEPGRRFGESVELRSPLPLKSADGLQLSLTTGSALKAGDRLVIDPDTRLADGAAVRLVAP